MCRPFCQHPLPPARHQPHLLISFPHTSNQKNTKNPKLRFKSQEFASYCLDLFTQNPGQREVHLEPTAKKNSEKINMLKRGRKTPEKIKLFCRACTHIWITALSEVDLEPNGKRGTNRTRALVSFYWSSQVLHLPTKSHTNQPK